MTPDRVSLGEPSAPEARDITNVSRVSMLKRIFIGRPLGTEEEQHQRLSKKVGLAVFSSDAISSTSYATQEILFVTTVGASSIALGVNVLIPIAIAVALLLLVVVISYRQTIHAYPSGGGSYVVSRENLGELAALLAGASLLVDYTLTVAVSVSEGVSSLISLVHSLDPYRVPLAVGFVLFIMLVNLRGVKESGAAFAGPTYIYMILLSALIITGLFKQFLGGGLEEIIRHLPPNEANVIFHEVKHTGIPGLSFGSGGHGIDDKLGVLTLFVALKGFSSGAVALSGVEAISNGVQAFKKPEPVNAGKTMIAMGLCLGSLFFGVSVLAYFTHPYPSEERTMFSQMAHVIWDSWGTAGTVLVGALLVSTAAILVLAANTAFADFPRLSSLIAKDGYLPKQFARRGTRLVFSNGIVFLSLAAIGLIIGFGARTNRLIPLYAVGVFTSFTLSQIGMVRHHLKERERHWQVGLAINLLGALTTAVVLVIVGVTKFVAGAWVVFIIVPALMALFWAIHRHYKRFAAGLALSVPEYAQLAREPQKNTVVVLVGKVHRGVAKALRYGQSMRPQHLTAVYIADGDESTERLQKAWEDLHIKVDLEIIHSPYRELVRPLFRYLDELDDRWGSDVITVIIPEFGIEHFWEQPLHNQTALGLKYSLFNRPNTVMISIPYHVGRTERGAIATEASKIAPGSRGVGVSGTFDTQDPKEAPTTTFGSSDGPPPVGLTDSDRPHDPM